MGSCNVKWFAVAGRRIVKLFATETFRKPAVAVPHDRLAVAAATHTEHVPHTRDLAARQQRRVVSDHPARV